MVERRGPEGGGSCQLSVVSCQLSVVSCQLSVVSCQRAEGIGVERREVEGRGPDGERQPRPKAEG